MSQNARTLDFPITFRVRGTHSSINATLLQLGIGGCRLRTWRIMPAGEKVSIELPTTEGFLRVEGRVRNSVAAQGANYEHIVELEPLGGADADRLARESAMLVRRARGAAA